MSVRGFARNLSVATLIIALAGGCATNQASISPSSGPTPSASTFPTPPVAATPSRAPGPPPTLVPLPRGWPKDWTPVQHQDSLGHLTLSAVAWTGARFIAVGDDYNDDYRGVVLDSSDGLTWRRQVMDLEQGEPALLVPGPRGIVMVRDNASWVSADGLTWAVRANPFGELNPASNRLIGVTAVVATDDGWLAVGAEHNYCRDDCGLRPIRAIVWTSEDGLDWTRVVDQPSLGGAAMTAVTRGGPGYVAVGWAGDHAAVWTSVDGRVWSRVPDGAQFHPPLDAAPSSTASMDSVVAAGGEIVATGAIGELYGAGFAPTAWWSPDGIDWARVADRPIGGDSFGPIVTVPGGFLAIGPRGDGGCLGGLWSSADGTLHDMLTSADASVWSCSSTDPAQSGFIANAVAASTGLLVLVGGLAGDSGSVVWVHGIP